MFAKTVGRRATALLTTLAVVVGLAITPAFVATAVEGDEPILAEQVVAEPVPVAPEAEPTPPAEVAEAPAAEPVEAPAPSAEPVEPPVDAQSPIAPLGARTAAPTPDEASSGNALVAAPTATGPEIWTNTLPNAVYNTPYSVQLDANRHHAPGQNVFLVASGSLPPGLTLDDKSGTITGRVRVDISRTYDFSITLTIKKEGTSEPRALGITVEGSAPVTPTPAILTDSLPDATVGALYEATQLSAIGLGATATWSASGLPAGLTIAESGLIAGTPTYEATYGAFKSVPVTLVARNGNTSVQKTININVITAAPTFGAQTLPNAPVEVSYNATLSNARGHGPLSFAVVNGSLPAGLNLASNGTISGEPTYKALYGSSRTFNFQVQVTSTAGSAIQAFSVKVVVPKPVVVKTTLVDGWIGQPYSQALDITGPGVVAVAIGLPRSLQLSGTTISGVPQRAGTFTFLVSAFNGAGIAAQILTITIHDAPNLHWMPAASIETGVAFTGQPKIGRASCRERV